MTWQDAVRCSTIGEAERDSTGNEREPWRIKVWTSASGRPMAIVRSGRYKTRKLGKRKRTALSLKRAARFDDWYPLKPHTALAQLALLA